MGELRRRFDDIACVLIGEGPERERLQALAQQLGVHLLLLGYRADPYPTMASFDVAVLPSRAEGMPRVILEAMALGVPCIATPPPAPSS
jgi:glycosyltransferase involved in cell wall biosynthesis